MAFGLEIAPVTEKQFHNIYARYDWWKMQSTPENKIVEIPNCLELHLCTASDLLLQNSAKHYLQDREVTSILGI
jgi:hypothetical protein